MLYLWKACTSALGRNTRLKLTRTLHAKIKLLPDKTNQLPLPIQSYNKLQCFAMFVDKLIVLLHPP